MRPSRLFLILGIALPVAHVSAAAPARAANGGNEDWPCIQRLVPQISPAQVWSGPIPEPAMWERDGEVARLGATIAARRTSMEDAQVMVAHFARGLGETREARLTALFGRALQVINRDRASLIAGIKRFSRKQAALAARVRQTRAALQVDDLSEEKRKDLTEALTWDQRIFEDREKTQIYLCEQPVLLEQRAFALGRAIGALFQPETER
ncbi:hypothetical protein [Breoghania sp.]|uniref:hypothetical protein n=1 Tax=Breoghania sp. TaxID=2065378 RepID=UPI0029C9D92A|nr:hypothetical protein [Breoghania sp.]